MYRGKRVGFRGGVFAVLLFTALVSQAQISVITERYDTNRTGANLSETRLNTSNVNVNQFGKLWSYTVNGSVYAQPLYVPNLTIAGGAHNVLYVVTMNDVVYAFDADSNNTFWSVNFTNAAAGITPVPIVDIVGTNSGSIVGNIGIESTPYIDLTSNTMYLLARTKENSQYFQRLHALDITTGAEKFGGPVVITASVSGTGNGSVNGKITFDSLIHNQRVSLAMAGGQIFIAWASHGDQHAYHGWVMSYNATTLQQTGVFCATPDGAQGGIWQSGAAPAVDANGNVYFETGNGDWNGTRNFGESFLKFSSSNGTLALLDWFTPDNWQSLNNSDLDIGSTGPLLIPGTNLLVGGSKDSTLYVLNTSSLGHEQSGNGQIPQHFSVNAGQIKVGPVYWNRSGGVGPWMYVWAENDFLKAYHFNGLTLDINPVSRSTIATAAGDSPGVLALSANGSTTGTGIVWSSMPLNQNGDSGTVHGVLRAMNADDLTKELWNSVTNQARDDIGLWPKFSLPTVVNGKVYMGSLSGFVSVFGLLPSQSVSGTITNGGGAVVTLSGATSTNTTADASGSYTFTGVPNGSYTVTPSKPGYAFTPQSQNVTVNGGNVTGVNFTAQAVTGGAVTIDAVTSADNNAAATSITSPLFSTNFGNELLLAFIASDAKSAGMTVSNVTGAGLTWVLVQRTNAQLGTAEVWRAFATAPLSNVSVTATLAQSVAASITIMSFGGADATGTNGAGAIGATASANSASGAPSATVLTTRNNSLVLGVGSDWDNAIARSPGTSQTVVHQLLASAGDTYWVQRQTSATPQSSTSVTINDTAPATDRYNLTVVEVLPAAVAGGSISGTIANGSGVTVTLSGCANSTTTTDPSGNYNFGGVPNGSCTVTPSKTGFTFTPTSQTVTVSNANMTGVNFTMVVYSISGTVSGPGGSGATMSLTGTSTTSVTADASGNYSFTGLANGPYTVTPSKSGFTFTPPSQNVTINNTSMPAVNFSTVTYSISGAIGGAGGNTATVNLTGTSTASVSADPSGNYIFTGLVNGPYTVTPSKSGFTFTPPNQPVTVSGGNVSGVSFSSAAAASFAISGTISGAGGNGATVNLTGTSSASTTADGSGNYSFSNLGNGSYTVTPSKSGFTFMPVNAPVTVNGAPVTGVNFTSAAAAGLAIDKSVSTDRSTSATTIASPAFTTAAGNELLLAFVSADAPSSGTNTTVSSIAGGGLTWVLVRRTNTQLGTAEVWRAFAPAVLTNATVTATLSRSVAASMTVVTFTGVDTTGTSGSGAIGATASSSAASGAPTGSLTTTRNGSWVFAVGNDWDNATARTVTAGQIMVHQYLATIGDTYWVQRITSTTPASGSVVTINDTAPAADRYDLTLVEVLPSL